MLRSFDKLIKALVFAAIGVFFIDFLTGAPSTVYRTVMEKSGWSSGRSEASYSSGYEQPREVFTVLLSDFPNLPAELQLAIVLAALGALLTVASHLVIVGQAILVSVGWGLVCLIVPFASLIYALVNFERCKFALCAYLVGIILIIISWIVVMLVRG
jgi:hypothetical protein